jgi:hypothetical protein
MLANPTRSHFSVKDSISLFDEIRGELQSYARVQTELAADGTSAELTDAQRRRAERAEAYLSSMPQKRTRTDLPHAAPRGAAPSGVPHHASPRRTTAPAAYPGPALPHAPASSQPAAAAAPPPATPPPAEQQPGQGAAASHQASSSSTPSGAPPQPHSHPHAQAQAPQQSPAQQRRHFPGDPFSMPALPSTDLISGVSKGVLPPESGPSSAA